MRWERHQESLRHRSALATPRRAAPSAPASVNSVWHMMAYDRGLRICCIVAKLDCCSLQPERSLPCTRLCQYVPAVPPTATNTPRRQTLSALSTADTSHWCYNTAVPKERRQTRQSSHLGGGAERRHRHRLLVKGAAKTGGTAGRCQPAGPGGEGGGKTQSLRTEAGEGRWGVA